MNWRVNKNYKGEKTYFSVDKKGNLNSLNASIYNKSLSLYYYLSCPTIGISEITLTTNTPEKEAEEIIKSQIFDNKKRLNNLLRDLNE